MTPSRLSALVTPALAIAGVWALLAFDPMARVRDRLAAIVAGLNANGVATEVTGDDLTVIGMDEVPGGGTVTTHMDHRIAMSFLTMGLAAAKPVVVDDVTMIATSFPEYQDLMRSLGAIMEAP